jgi:serine protease AprX
MPANHIRRVAASAALVIGLAIPAAASARTVIVQLQPASDAAPAIALVHAGGGTVGRQLPLIHGFTATVTDVTANLLTQAPGVRVVSADASVRGTDADLATSFNESIRADKAWKSRPSADGSGVSVAILDTGIAGGLRDFSDAQGRSRVIATAVTNRDATTASDRYGHGTHIAGLVAGDDGAHRGSAPGASLVSVKVSDDHGNVSVADVVAGLQFVIDHRTDLGIRVVNLSLSSSASLPASEDPLDAAVEAVWQAGVVVVTSAGNRGTDSDSVDHAPANDPFVISVGAVDDRATKTVSDDALASWSSRGTTVEGAAKPEVLAPGAHMVSTLAPASDFAAQCPTCITPDGYFRVGGTSMAAGVVSGAVADLLSAHPGWTPDQVKGALVNTARDVRGAGVEIDVQAALKAKGSDLTANVDARWSPLLGSATGDAALDRLTWGRVTWGRVTWGALAPDWAQASYTCDCPSPDDGQPVGESRITWGRISWGRVTWGRVTWGRVTWGASFAK